MTETNWSVETTAPEVSSSNQKYSEFHIRFHVSRLPEYYLWNIVLTMSFIISMYVLSVIFFLFSSVSLSDLFSLLPVLLLFLIFL